MPDHGVRRATVRFGGADVELEGDLSLPPAARAIVLFAHGSGSSRHSPRNQFVAQKLVDAGLGTLLFDLLMAEEEERDRLTAELRFRVHLLAHRLQLGAMYVRNRLDTRDLPIGYFGASTGAAAALIADAEAPGVASAIVSRGGRPDLAGDALEEVRAPTLLIVGGEDTEVIELNWDAYARLRCEKRMEIVPGATHLFEESGTLEAVAGMATAWFIHHLVEWPAEMRAAAEDDMRGR